MKQTMDIVKLGEILSQDTQYVQDLEPRTYPKLSVKLYGRGVVMDAPADGSSVKMEKHQLARSGQVILSEIWAKKGAIGIVPPEGNGALCTSHFFLFDIDRVKAFPSFVHWLLRGNYFEPQLNAEARGTTGYAAIRPKQFLATSIPLPPLHEQKRIVARIEELAAKVQEAQSSNRESVLELLAIGKSYSNALFANSAFQTRPLADVCSVITDGTHQTPRYADDGAIFLSAQNVKPFRFMPEVHRKVSHEDFLGYTARNKPARGDVLLTRVGAGIGEAAVVDQDIEFAIYVSLALIRPISAILTPEYLVQWLNSPSGRAHSRTNTLGKGHSQGNLNLNLLRSFPIPIPSLKEQRQIVAKLETLQAKIEAMRLLQSESAAELNAMLPAILDKAFKGEL